jgi:hypothetical protein
MPKFDEAPVRWTPMFATALAALEPPADIKAGRDVGCARGARRLPVTGLASSRRMTIRPSVGRGLKTHVEALAVAVRGDKSAASSGTIRNLVCGAIVKKARGACYGDQER